MSRRDRWPVKIHPDDFIPDYVRLWRMLRSAGIPAHDTHEVDVWPHRIVAIVAVRGDDGRRIVRNNSFVTTRRGVWVLFAARRLGVTSRAPRRQAEEPRG
jgi:hypothetical protein